MPTPSQIDYACPLEFYALRRRRRLERLSWALVIVALLAGAALVILNRPTPFA